MQFNTQTKVMFSKMHDDSGADQCTLTGVCRLQSPERIQKAELVLKCFQFGWRKWTFSPSYILMAAYKDRHQLFSIELQEELLKTQIHGADTAQHFLCFPLN